MGWFSDTFRGRNINAPRQSSIESDTAFSERIAHEARAHGVEDATGAPPRKSVIESEEGFRDRVAQEADEGAVERLTGRKPRKGVFESDEAFRQRMGEEANQEVVRARDSSRARRSSIESEDAYNDRMSIEARRAFIVEATGVEPRRGVFESEQAYRARLTREANLIRASPRRRADDETREFDIFTFAIQAAASLMFLAAVLTPFLPIFMLAGAAFSLGNTIGLWLGGAILVGGLGVLYAFRHARAIYFFPYAFVLQGALFLAARQDYGLLAALGTAFVVATVLYRLCFSAWRWRGDVPVQARAWVVAGVAGLASMLFDGAVAVVRPQIAYDIAAMFGARAAPERDILVEAPRQPDADAPAAETPPPEPAVVTERAAEPEAVAPEVAPEPAAPATPAILADGDVFGTLSIRAVGEDAYEATLRTAHGVEVFPLQGTSWRLEATLRNGWLRLVRITARPRRGERMQIDLDARYRWAFDAPDDGVIHQPFTPFVDGATYTLAYDHRQFYARRE